MAIKTDVNNLMNDSEYFLGHKWKIDFSGLSGISKVINTVPSQIPGAEVPEISVLRDKLNLRCTSSGLPSFDEANDLEINVRGYKVSQGAGSDPTGEIELQIMESVHFMALDFFETWFRYSNNPENKGSLGPKSDYFIEDGVELQLLDNTKEEYVKSKYNLKWVKLGGYEAPELQEDIATEPASVSITLNYFDFSRRKIS